MEFFTDTYTLAIRSTTRLPIKSLEFTEYMIVYGKREFGKLDITRKECDRRSFIDYIREHGFVKLYRNEDGTIYGDADNSFKKNLCPNGLTDAEKKLIGKNSDGDLTW